MKKKNGEKALAVAAGISVPLLRYYRARGIGNDAEESAAAEALRQAEILRGAGFSAEAAARILHSEEVEWELPEGIYIVRVVSPSLQNTVRVHSSR